ncbi:hypothetical protein IJ750_06545, partial [bacterium]|nr:hypothetical protein [bacterium]
QTSAAQSTTKMTSSQVQSGIVDGTLSTAKAVSTLKSDLNAKVVTTKTANNKTVAKTNVGGKAITINTNAKDVPITTSGSTIDTAKTVTINTTNSTPTTEKTGSTSNTGATSTTGSAGKTGGTSSTGSVGGTKTSTTTEKTGSTSNTGATSTTGSAGKTGGTSGVGNVNGVNNASKVYTAQDLAKYKLDETVLLQFFNKVGNNYTLKNGISFETFEAAVPMVQEMLGDSVISSKLTDSTQLTNLLKTLEKSDKELNFENFETAVKQYFGVDKLSLADEMTVMTVFSGLVTQLTGISDDNALSEFLDTNKKSFGEMFDDYAAKKSSSTTSNSGRAGAPRRANSNGSSIVGDVVVGLLDNVGAVISGALPLGPAAVIASIACDAVSLMANYGLAKNNGASEAELKRILVAGFANMAIGVIASSIPGGKVLIKNPFVKAAIDTLIRDVLQAYFVKFSDAFEDNKDGKTTNRGGGGVINNRGGNGQFTYDKGFTQYGGFTVNTGNGSSVEFGPFTATGIVNDDGTISSIYTRSDGTVGTFGSGHTDNTHIDGVGGANNHKPGETWVDANGTECTLGQDGSLTCKYKNGTVVVFNADGSEVTIRPNGDVTVTPPTYGSGNSGGTGSGGASGTNSGGSSGGQQSNPLSDTLSGLASWATAGGNASLGAALAAYIAGGCQGNFTWTSDSGSTTGSTGYTGGTNGSDGSNGWASTGGTSGSNGSGSAYDGWASSGGTSSSQSWNDMAFGTPQGGSGNSSGSSTSGGGGGGGGGWGCGMPHNINISYSFGGSTITGWYDSYGRFHY